MQIRKQTASDLPFICSILQQAFASPVEADLVVQLIVGGYDRITLVAEQDGKLVGQILFSEVSVVTEEGPMTALSLAPVSVTPQFQRQGVGTALICAGLEACVDAGYSLVFVLGDPAYYERFGFNRARALGYRTAYAGDYFLALQLPEANVPAGTGRLVYPPPFDALAATS